MLKAPVIVAIGVAALSVQTRPPKPPVESSVVLQLPGRIPLDMVRVPAGVFTMGSPDSEMKTDEHVGKEPLHRVIISHPFYLSKYEVTQRQYRALTGANPSQVQGDDLPVTNVSWEQAVAFAKHASEVLKRRLRVALGVCRARRNHVDGIHGGR